MSGELHHQLAKLLESMPELSLMIEKDAAKKPKRPIAGENGFGSAFDEGERSYASRLWRMKLRSDEEVLEKTRIVE
jgi:hypothetical protein